MVNTLLLATSSSPVNAEALLRLAMARLRQNGIFALHVGSSRLVIPGAVAGAIPFGSYGPTKAYLAGEGSSPNAGHRLLAGLLAGTLRHLVMEPYNVALLRLATLRSQPAGPNLSDVGRSFVRTFREYGLRGLYAGNREPTPILIAMQLGGYDQVKHMLLERKIMQDGVLLHSCAAFTAATSAVISAAAYEQWVHGSHRVNIWPLFTTFLTLMLYEQAVNMYSRTAGQ